MIGRIPGVVMSDSDIEYPQFKLKIVRWLSA